MREYPISEVLYMDKQKMTDYKRQFNEQKYDRLYPYVPKGRKAEIQAAADTAGETLNEFIVEAIDERMERLKHIAGESNEK